jgi:4-amino-4-deoxy-L-arabinose transferase-like glycosyltransferase
MRFINLFFSMDKQETLERDFSRFAFWTIAGACAIYIIGWFINVMDIDSAQYASISRLMLERGNYLEFLDRTAEYLDKPPLLFWVSGISMKIFGINNIAFRIPAFLATLLALYSTFRLAALFYDKKTGYLAAAILATLQAVFLINHDVRTDTNLMCWFIFSMWQFAEFLEHKKTGNFIFAFIGVGLAMLAKGPIGLVAPAMGIFMHLVLRKQWKDLFNPNWLLGMIIVAIVLLPMSYGLYTQFDLHPEKTINGQHGVSGLRFYYWTQSFGRITGESSWNNNAGPFFLTHTTLWAFAPWSLFLITGLFSELKNFVNHIRGKGIQREFMVLFGFLLPFMALSSSRYQLPHYAFIVYPLGAIITAKYILKIFYSIAKNTNALYYIHTILILLFLVFVFALTWFSFQNLDLIPGIGYLVGLLIYSYVAFMYKNPHRLVIASVVMILLANLVMNGIFYPHLLKYQGGSEIAIEAIRDGAANGTFFSYRSPVSGSMDFYANMMIPIENDLEKIATKNNIWVYVRGENYLNEILQRRPDAKIIRSTGAYSVTILTPKFLNPATRDSTLRKTYLIKL